MAANVTIVTAGTPQSVTLGDNTTEAKRLVAPFTDLAITVDVANSNYFAAGAGNASVTGTYNTGFGPEAGSGLSTGSRNTLNGDLAARDIGAGNDNVISGHLAAYRAAGITDSVVMGSGTLIAANGAVMRATVIGKSAAAAYLDDDATDITAVGAYALTNATGAGHTALGSNAGGGMTTGARGTFLGYNANGAAALDDQIAIGYGSLTTRAREIALGTGTQEYLQMFGLGFAHWDADGFNLWIGDDGPAVDPTPETGQFNMGLGRAAANGITTGAANLGIGTSALESQQTGNNAIAVGTTAAQNATDIYDCAVMGVKAARYWINGTGGTAFGFRSQEHNASAGNNTSIGDSTLWHSQGISNFAGGYVCAEGMSQGDYNVFLGSGAARYRDDGDENVFLGHLSGAVISNSLPGQPGENIGVGDNLPADNIGGAAAGHRNVGVGTMSLGNYLGNNTVAVGDRAGLLLVGTAATDGNNVFIGGRSGNDPGALQKVDAVNSIAIGADTYTTADNQVVIGNASVTETILRGTIVSGGPVRLVSYTVATVPSASSAGAGALIYVTNDAGGAVPAFSDGTTWRRTTDRLAIAA